MPTFHQASPDQLLQRFPRDPWPSLDPPWQQDEQYRRQTRELLRRGDWGPLLGELLGFLQLLETAPSVGFQTPLLPRQPGNGDDGKGRKGAENHRTAEGDSSTPARREELIHQLGPAVRLAYLAFCFAESKASRRLEDKEAYDLLKEDGIPEGAGDRGELAEYRLPAFDSWARYLREARNVLNERKYTRRAGRPLGKSITKGGQVERLTPDDE
jgi:hypothetical protein